MEEISMTIRTRNAVLITVLQAICAACGIPTEAGDVVRLRIEGSVTFDNKPLEGATVNLEGTIFVWTLPLVSDTTDASGRYTIEANWNCEEGADINVSPGNSGMLVVYATGYQSVSSINIGRALICTDATQRVDFALSRAAVP
jgi:hypothetical protein